MEKMHCCFLTDLYTHLMKVYVWGGISMACATKLYIFEGIMNAQDYVQLKYILQDPNATSISSKAGNPYLFMQVNDPSKCANGIPRFEPNRKFLARIDGI